MSVTTLAGTILLVFMSLVCTAQRHAVDIIDTRKTNDPAPTPANHKDHDVLVRRELSKASDGRSMDVYTVYFYRKERDTIRQYQCGLEATDDVDKATYRWPDDSLAIIHLYNSKSKKKRIDFEVFGKHTADGKKSSGVRQVEN